MNRQDLVYLHHTLKNANTEIKNIRRNQGLVPNHLSIDQPITPPTTIPETSSVLNLKAKPKEFPRFSIFSEVLIRLSFDFISSTLSITSDGFLDELFFLFSNSIP